MPIGPMPIGGHGIHPAHGGGGIGCCRSIIAVCSSTSRPSHIKYLTISMIFSTGTSRITSFSTTCGTGTSLTTSTGRSMYLTTSTGRSTYLITSSPAHGANMHA